MTHPDRGSALVDGVDLDQVVAAVRACPGVDDLVGGAPTATVATYLAGRRIEGLRLTDDVLTVQIRGVWDVPFAAVGDQVRAGVAPLVGGRRIDLVVADLTAAPGYEPTTVPESEPAPEPQPEPVPAQVVEPMPRSNSALDGEPETGLTTTPVVLERTVSVTEKVLEGDPASWPSQIQTQNGEGGGASTSDATTPTPAEVPPHSSKD